MPWYLVRGVFHKRRNVPINHVAVEGISHRVVCSTVCFGQELCNSGGTFGSQSRCLEDGGPNLI